jgi:RNA polymerase sigma-B factor
VERVSDELIAETGHSPTAAQIAARAGMGMEDVLEAREAFRALHSDSLDQPRGAREDDDAGSLLDTLGDPDLELGRAHDRAALSSVLDTLDERDRTIIRLYYKEELTQAEIGRALGYSQMHVSRLLRQAVERLRAEATQQEDKVTNLVAAAAA